MARILHIEKEKENIMSIFSEAVEEALQSIKEINKRS